MNDPKEKDQRVILKVTLENGGTGNVMYALGWDVDRFDEGFALANELQNFNWVKLLYSNFNKNLVVVELTLIGISKAKKELS